MNNWKVTLLYYGKITLPKIAMTPNFDPDLEISIPYLGFLMQKDGRNIVVDTGIDEHYIVDGKAWGGWPAEGGYAYVEKALDDAGVKAEDVETVFYTHLHNDHAGSAKWFKNAQHVFQKNEWAALVNPIPAVDIRGDYDYSLIEMFKKMDCIRIDGDMNWEDGVDLYTTPGHTPGSMTVAVRTDQGTKFIVGDHWHMHCMAFGWQTEMIDMEGNKHKITPAPPVYQGLIPSSLIYDYYEYYDSCYKLKALMKNYSPEFLLPGHEPAIVYTGV